MPHAANTNRPRFQVRPRPSCRYRTVHCTLAQITVLDGCGAVRVVYVYVCMYVKIRRHQHTVLFVSYVCVCVCVACFAFYDSSYVSRSFLRDDRRVLGCGVWRCSGKNAEEKAAAVTQTPALLYAKPRGPRHRSRITHSTIA